MTFRFKYANFSILFLILLFIFGGKTNGYCQVFNYPEQDTDNWGIGLNVGLLHYRSNVNSGSTIGCGITISKIFICLMILIPALIGNPEPMALKYRTIPTATLATTFHILPCRKMK